MTRLTPQDAEILRVLRNVGFIGKRPTRRHCVDLVFFTRMSRTTVDKRLQHMKGEGLIEDDGEYRHRLYWATDAGMAALAAWASEHGGEG